MAQPPRHGNNWDRVGPSPADFSSPPPRPTAPRTASSPAGPAPAPTKQVLPIPLPVEIKTPVLTARTLNTFFQMLPLGSVQFFNETGEARVTASNLVPGGSIVVLDTKVPDKTVWVITGAHFFGLCPSSYLEAPLTMIAPEQLIGLLRFRLKLADRESVQTHGVFVNPLTAVSAATVPNAGLPTSNPALNFAIYGRSNQTVKVIAEVDAAPRFWLSVLGARLAGFALPEMNFDTIISRITDNY